MFRMATAVSDVRPTITHPTILERLSVPRQLAWGYVGLLLFMIGDGIEAGYLAPFLRVAYVGEVGCTITTLLLYYLPLALRGNYRLENSSARRML
jgi:hypothetical protein